MTGAAQEGKHELLEEAGDDHGDVHGVPDRLRRAPAEEALPIEERAKRELEHVK